MAKTALTFRLLHTAAKPTLENDLSTYKVSSTHTAPSILMGLLIEGFALNEGIQELCTLNIRLLVAK